MIYDGSVAIAVASEAVPLSRGMRAVTDYLDQPIQAQQLIITALATNTGTVAVGGDHVLTTTGTPLRPGEPFPRIINSISLADVWINATTIGDGVQFSYEAA